MTNEDKLKKIRDLLYKLSDAMENKKVSRQLFDYAVLIQHVIEDYANED
jgi:hypothetical protein